ncbi:MAG: hypothetical protein DMF84_06240 [Acidobacteria bacterium]|nr:MAG: hypothetical protein DMF84_06240 [Acidobacteriota bacterium]
MTLSAGDRLGFFEFVNVIGAGGMGTVYCAVDTRLGRTVAIKLVKDLSANPHARARLVREAQHAAALNHEHLHDLGNRGSKRLPVYRHGACRRTSDEGIASGGGVPLERVVRYAVQIADAAAHAHDHGIVHRDLKGLNVIITAGGRVKILDFGLATHTWSEGAEYAATIHLTHRDVIAGTIAYMAPEVLPDVGDVGRRGA